MTDRLFLAALSDGASDGTQTTTRPIITTKLWTDHLS